MSERNDDLVAISATLNELARAIHEKKLVTTDIREFRALNEALIDINHRITTVGGQIFARRSKQIADAAEAVQERKAQVDQAIKDIERIQHFLDTVHAFLGLVDNVVGLSRKLALAV